MRMRAREENFVRSVLGSTAGLGRVNVIAPKNYGMSGVVQQRLSAVIVQANDQFENSLAVDGSQAFIWHRSNAGRICTCQNTRPKQDSFTDLMNNNPTENNIIAQGEEEFTGKGEKRHRYIIREADTSQLIPNRRYLGTAASADPSFVPSPTDSNINQLDPNMEFDTLSSGERDLSNELALFNQNSSGFLFGGDGTPCGICIGTGYIEGYSFLNGKRIILDASDVTAFNAVGISLNRQTFPFSFIGECDINNSVTWPGVELPTYFVNFNGLVVRNNTQPCENMAITVDFHDGNGFVPYSLTQFSNTNGSPTIVDVKVSPMDNNEDGNCQFTHLEMTYQLVPPFLAQLSPQTPTFSADRERDLVETSIVLSSRVPEIKIFDIIYLDKYDALYKISETTDAYTAQRQVMGWNSVNVRLIQSYDYSSLLRLAFNPNLNTAFAGL